MSGHESNPASSREELLEKEMEELHNYVRSHFQLLVGWFTFFCTVLVGAAAWGVGASVNGSHKLVDPLPSFVVGCYFTVQILFGCVACWFANRDFRRIDARIGAIQGYLAGPREKHLQPRSAMPRGIEHIVLMMILSLLSVLPFLWWIYHIVARLPKTP